MNRLIGLTITSLIFFSALGIAEWVMNRTLFLAPAFVFISLITFVVYAIDKATAQKGRWRTPEAHLHLLALLGGWPGAMIAQQALRHKSKKISFRLVYWITILFNCTAVVWLLTSTDLHTLSSILRQTF